MGIFGGQKGRLLRYCNLGLGMDYRDFVAFKMYAFLVAGRVSIVLLAEIRRLQIASELLLCHLALSLDNQKSVL